MLAIAGGTTVAILLFVVEQTFSWFKRFQKDVPKQITSKQRRRLIRSAQLAMKQTVYTVTNYYFSYDALCALLAYMITLDAKTAFMTLILSIFCFYRIDRDIGKLGIVWASYSSVSPLYVCCLQTLLVNHMFKNENIDVNK